MENAYLIKELTSIVSTKNILIKDNKTQYYRSGFRSGSGSALAVVFPTSLLQQWYVIQACVKANCIIIMQAAKTGITEGSTPKGCDYDRNIIIVNITKINQIYLLGEGSQALCLSGSRLYELEQKLNRIGRVPHSVIGSSSIGASVIGGIANNSGGALVKRGPAYTELSLFAQVNNKGELHLVNHLGIKGLGETPEEILTNIQTGNICHENVEYDENMASDRDYEQYLRDINSNTPARFNADKRRLYEASGCAGKLAVFAVRVDTFSAPKKEQVFYLGTNNPEKLTQLRKDILTNFTYLPEMAEYMHRDIFTLAEKYGKDTFLSIKLLGSNNLPKLFSLKGKIESFLQRIPLVNKYLFDYILYYLSQLFPQHLPKRMLNFRDNYQHHLILKTSDNGIEEAKNYLNKYWRKNNEVNYFICNRDEAKKALLHRFAAASAAIRYETIHKNEVENIVALDIALRRNDDNWREKLPQSVKRNLVKSLYYGHFLCHVFHQDYIFKKGTNIEEMKQIMLKELTNKGAKYPAEHNVGHLYEAEKTLQTFYKRLDPTNTFNPGIGKMSKLKRNCNCC